MSTRFCTRCGTPLRDGACPRGHPQRAVRGRRRQRQRWPWVVVGLVVLVAAGAYAAVVWYPTRGAESLMRPSSAEYERALTEYRSAVEAFPEPDGGPAALREAGQVLEETEAARQAMVDGQLALEERTVAPIPFVSQQPPLDAAIDLRARMLAFYGEGLRTLGRLDTVARYLGELARTLRPVRLLRAEVDPADGEPDADAAAVAAPVAEQLRADLRALVPPDELGSLHASLQAIVRRVASDLDDVEGAQQEGDSPVVSTLLDGIASEAASFRGAVVGAPEEALDSGLGASMEQLENRAARINEGLEGLRAAGVPGITVPE